MRRMAVATALVVMWSLAAMTVAAADPPGPTDFMSEVTEIDPDVPGFSIAIIGGDSFVLLSVDAGVVVEVVGYQGEPYLRFLSDGTVEENQAAPSTYLNEDRYAAGEVPSGAAADAAPDWKVVADDGSYAWHDHRTHWMNPVPPPGQVPGDRVVEGVVPLLVDGVEVDVAVVSVWQQPPSPLPVLLGLMTGALFAYMALRRRDRQLVSVVLFLAISSTIVGVGAYLSVPSETGPPWSLWVFPATSALLTLLVAVAGTSGGWVERQRRTLLLIAALELIGWGIAHWGWLWPSILPTALPYWLDRFVASMVLVGALGAAAAVMVAATAPPLDASSTGLLRAPRPRRLARRRSRN